MLNYGFKVGKFNAEELQTAKNELDEIFSIVKGKNGKLVPSAVKKLDDNRYDIAELILQVINETYLITDPTPLLVEVVDGDIRNNYLWRELDSTLRVVNRSYGTKPISQRLTFKEHSISTSMKEIAVEIPLEEVAAGSTTPSQVAESMAQAILRYRIAAVLDGIDAGVTSGADLTGESGYTKRYSGLTQANLDKAIDGLLDDSEAVTIFSRHIALAPTLRTFSDFSDEVKDDMTRRGVIGMYHNAQILTLRDQYSQVDASHLISKDRVYLAASRKGAIWMQKDVSFLNWALVDPRSSSFGVGTRLEDGMLVRHQNRYRIIEA